MAGTDTSIRTAIAARIMGFIGHLRWRHDAIDMPICGIAHSRAGPSSPRVGQGPSIGGHDVTGDIAGPKASRFAQRVHAIDIAAVAKAVAITTSSLFPRIAAGQDGVAEFDPASMQ